MRLRPLQIDKDFDEIKKWISDERMHRMWCANWFAYPLEKENFISVLHDVQQKNGDAPFVATTDEGKLAGFFCYSSNLDTQEGMLKFVIINNSIRGNGYGKEMIELASKYAFEIAKDQALQLNVFVENTGAVKCYMKAGFEQRRYEEKNFLFQQELWSKYNMIKNKNI